MAVHDIDELHRLMGKTNDRQDIWLWLFLKHSGEADFDFDTCNGLTMRSTLAGAIERNGDLSSDRLLAEMDRYLVPAEYLAWISGEERQTRWLDNKVRDLTKMDGLWSIPRLTGKDLLLGAIDLWGETISQKTRSIRHLQLEWDRHTSHDHLLHWFEDKKDGAARCRFAWDWLKKDKSLKWGVPSYRFESHTELQMYFDSNDLRERELKDIAQSIRRSWNRQRYLEQLEGKKQFNFILSEETVELLDALARANDLRRPQMLENLIRAEADRKKIGAQNPKY